MVGKKNTKIQVNKEVFRNNLQSNFSSGMLTLISILMGVILAVAVDQITKYNDPDIVLFFHAIVTLLFISGTFYFYYYFVSVFFVPPRIMQVLVVFFLGMTELAAAQSIGSPRGFIGSMNLVLLAAVIAFLNTFYLLKRNMYSDNFQGAYELYRGETIKNIVCFTLMLVGNGYFWISYPGVTDVFSFTKPPVSVSSEVYQFFWLIMIFVNLLWWSDKNFLDPLISLSEEGEE